MKFRQGMSFFLELDVPIGGMAMGVEFVSLAAAKRGGVRTAERLKRETSGGETFRNEREK